MTDQEIANWLREVASDVQERTDDEALAALHRAVARDRRRRHARVGMVVAAAAGLIGLVGWIVVPADDQVSVTSDGNGRGDATTSAPETTPPMTEHVIDGLRVEVNLDRYTGVAPPLVAVTAGGDVEVIDVMSLSLDDRYEPYATVDADFPVSWAAAGPRGTSVFLVDDTNSAAVLFDLADPGIVGSWANTISVAASPDHETIARVESHDGRTSVVTENLRTGVLATFDPPPDGPQPTGPLTWSPSGLLAVGHDDGSVAVFDLARDAVYEDADLIEGPLHAPDWTTDNTLIGTTDCCVQSPVQTAVVPDGAVEAVPDVEANQVVSPGPDRSPWGIFVLNPDGTVHGTNYPETIILIDVAQLHL